MESEYELIHTMRELVQMKEEYVKVQAALEVCAHKRIWSGGTGALGN